MLIQALLEQRPISTRSAQIKMKHKDVKFRSINKLVVIKAKAVNSCNVGLSTPLKENNDSCTIINIHEGVSYL